MQKDTYDGCQPAWYSTNTYGNERRKGWVRNGSGGKQVDAQQLRMKMEITDEA